MSEASRMNWPSKVWRAAVVVLGLLFIVVTLALALDLYYFGATESFDWSIAAGADIAVMMTAIGVWFEYVRSRRKARRRLPRLDTVQADLATLAGRVKALEDRPDAALT